MKSKIAKLLLAASFALSIFVAILFLFATTSVLESFQLYPHDEGGGFALFLLEVVIASIVAAVGGLLYLHRLWFGCWFPSDRDQPQPREREPKQHDLK